MSYNLYLSRMKISEVKKLKSMDANSIIRTYNTYFNPDEPEEENYIPGPYKFGEQLYSLGSYPDYEAELIDNYGKRIFEFIGASDYYASGYEFSEIGECGLKFIIDYYAEKTANYYATLNETLTIIGADDNKLHNFLRIRINKWRSNNILKLDGDKHKLSNDGDYEYAIFSLTALYKSFDWNEYTLILYGY